MFVCMCMYCFPIRRGSCGIAPWETCQKSGDANILLQITYHYIVITWNFANFCLPPHFFLIHHSFAFQRHHSIQYCNFYLSVFPPKGNAPLATFLHVISKIVGATYYQRNACVLPYISFLISVKATGQLPSYMTKFVLFPLCSELSVTFFVSRSTARFTWLLFFTCIL